MLTEQPMRASLQVAPLTINKKRSGSLSNSSSTSDQTTSTSTMYTAVSQYTPPTTPNGSQEELNTVPSSSTVFHNFLRAFYPFHPTYAMSDSTITLPLNEGDVILVHSIHTNGWADGTLLVSGARGWLPTNYCEAYDPDEMKVLLNALLMFWDLLRSTSVNDSEVFGNQEFMKGIIAGVRSLLERTHCLTRESVNVQRNDDLRRGRKSLLSELSSLVKVAKRLQETQRITVEPHEDINDIVDEMILKAFKIVTKGVRFLDILEEDKRQRAPAVAFMSTVVEETYIPPTPPAEEISSFEDNSNQSLDVASRVYADETTHEATPYDPADAVQTTVLPTKRSSSLASPARAARNSYRMSKTYYPLQARRLSTTISHRVSLAGPSPLSTPQHLVSERLGLSHDTFLSYLGSFIGRLHLQSQSRPDLALAIKQAAGSGGELLSVVDVVCLQTSCGDESLTNARATMYHRISELVNAAKDILTTAGPEMDIIMPQDNGRLLSAATGCVKAAGECVVRTKYVIEKIGDFEFEHADGSLGIDLSVLDVIPEERPLSAPKEEPSVKELTPTAESQPEEPKPAPATPPPAEETAPEPDSEPTPTSAPVQSVQATPRPAHLGIDKPLPDVPQIASPTEERSQPSYSPASSRPQSYIDDAASSMASSVSSIRPTLPPLPKLSTSLLSTADFGSVDQSSSQGDSHVSPHTESQPASSISSTGSNHTYLSRDSEASFASKTSTRATTPDLTTQPSLSELSTAGSSNQGDEVEALESKILTKTFANELMFNKEGMVTGGSLPALVERLTTHEATPDAMFVSTFYLTFRLFCTPGQLAEALIDRFEYIGDSPEMASPVRLRVYNVFKGWMESNWRDETDHEALDIIRRFAEFKLSAAMPSASERLLALAERVTSTDGSLVPRLVSSMSKAGTSISQSIPADTPLPTPVITKSQIHAINIWKLGSTCPTILDFEPLEIARQLTLKQMNVFCSILPEELLGSQWMKNGGVGSPNVKAMTALSTDLSNIVADTILQHHEVKKRAAVIKQWIKIAHQCLELNNYDSLMAIICSLNSSTITRLRKTWDAVSPKRREMLKTLQDIVEPSNNNKVLRGRLHDHVPPCLPFLGMFLTDLTFVDIGNPATKQLSNGTEEGGLAVINFDKHARTAKIIGELQRFQIPYRLAEVPELQDWLQGQIQRMRESDQSNVQVSYYRRSLLLEPRENVARSQLDGQTGHSQTDLFRWMSRDRSNTQTATPAGMI